MTRLAGIDIALPPVVVIPVLLLRLLALAARGAPAVTRLTARWLGGRGNAVERGAPAPGLSLGAPFALAALAWGVQQVLPELRLPERLSRAAAGALGVVLVLTCALALVRIAI